MEENGKEKKKTNPGVILIFLGILLIGIGIFLSNYSSTKKETPKPKEEEKEVSVTIDKTIVDYYVKPFIGSSIPSSVTKIYEENTYSVNDFTPQEKLELISDYIQRNSPNVDVLLESDVQSIFEEVYGKDTYEKAKEFEAPNKKYNYNEMDNSYIGTNYHRDIKEYSNHKIFNGIIDYKATNKKLEITVAYAFVNTNSKVCPDYFTCTNGEEFTESLYKDTENYFKENIDKFNTITYIFEKQSEDLNYYFTQLTCTRRQNS